MAKKSDYVREIDPNRKSSRSFNLEKNERRCFDLEKEDGKVSSAMDGATNLSPDSLRQDGENNSFSKKWLCGGFIVLLIVGAVVLWLKGCENKRQEGKTSNDPTQMEPQVRDKSAEEDFKERDSSAVAYGNDVPLSADTVNLTRQTTSSQAVSPQEMTSGNTKEATSSTDGKRSKGTEIKLSSFAFGEMEGTVTPELKELVEKLKSDPTLKVTVAGYTDRIGDLSYNEWLSEKRAQSVKTVLVRNGIDANRIKAVGKGVSTRYATNRENRRVVWILE